MVLLEGYCISVRIIVEKINYVRGYYLMCLTNSVYEERGVGLT